VSKETKRSGHSVLGLVSVVLGFSGLALAYFAQDSGWGRSWADEWASLCLILVGFALGMADILQERKTLLFPILGTILNWLLLNYLLINFFFLWALTR